MTPLPGNILRAGQKTNILPCRNVSITLCLSGSRETGTPNGYAQPTALLGPARIPPGTRMPTYGNRGKGGLSGKRDALGAVYHLLRGGNIQSLSIQGRGG